MKINLCIRVINHTNNDTEISSLIPLSPQCHHIKYKQSHFIHVTPKLQNTNNLQILIQNAPLTVSVCTSKIANHIAHMVQNIRKF